MKFFIRLITFVSIFIINHNQIFAQWTKLNGLNSASILYIPSLAADENRLFAGTNSGIFLSLNNGINWTEVNTGLTNKNVYCVDIKGNYIFAGTNDGIFLSTNNGTDWIQKINGLPDNILIRRFAFKENNIIAGAEPGGVFLSSDNGSSWNEISNGLSDKRITSFASVENNLFAGTHGGGVFHSSNNGESWSEVNNGLTNKFVISMAVIGNNLFAGTEGGGVFRSTNNGMDWNEINTGLTYKNINSLVVKGSNVFAAAEREVFLSTNNGNSWKKVSTGLNSVLLSLTVNEQYIFAGTYADGIWRCKLSDLLTDVEHGVKQAPENFELHQNFPNPFNPSTTLSYSLPEEAKVKIEIYNLIGQKLTTLIDKTENTGNHNIVWNANNFPTGTYLCKIKAEGMNLFEKVQKLVLLK